jgi:FK506-binding nuclear protein
MIISPWGLTVKPGATYKYEIPPFANLKISNAALGAKLEDDHSRTTLTIEAEERTLADSEDEELDEDEDKPPLTNIVLTSLTPGKVGTLDELLSYTA